MEADSSAASTRARLSWAQLLKLVFAIDLTTCPQCGGTLTILAAIEDPAVIIKVLTHLGLPSRAPPRAPARLDALLQIALSPPLFGSVLEATGSLCPVHLRTRPKRP